MRRLRGFLVNLPMIIQRIVGWIMHIVQTAISMLKLHHCSNKKMDTSHVN